MASVPERLDDWNIEVVNALTEVGEGESDRHDFKAGLPDAGRLSDDVSAFANTRGGFIVFGVAEVGKSWRVEGLEPDKEFSPQLWDRIRVNPTPTVSHPRVIPLDDSEERVLYVVQIGAGSQGPYVPLTSKQLKFLKRVGGKNEHMTLEEIRGDFRDTDRQMMGLRLLYQEMIQNAQVLRGYEYAQRADMNWERLELSAVDNAIANSFALISDHPRFLEELFGMKRLMVQFNRKRDYYIHRSALVSNPQPVIEEGSHHAVAAVRSIYERMKVLGAMLEQEFGFEDAGGAFLSL